MLSRIAESRDQADRDGEGGDQRRAEIAEEEDRRPGRRGRKPRARVLRTSSIVSETKSELL